MQASYTTGEYLFGEISDMTLTERYDTNYEQKLINEYNAAMIGLYPSEDEKTKRILVYIEYLIERDRLKNLIDNDSVRLFVKG